ncbi:MAG: hypothetical protein H6711_04290 [Myxococcales bacterium]|nr:hypothetical protein [Myxococcales bacterium]
MSEAAQGEPSAWTRADAAYHALLAPELGEAARDPTHEPLLAARALRLRAAKLGGFARPASEVSLAPLARLPALHEVELTRTYLRQADVDALADLPALAAITLRAYGDAIQDFLDLAPLAALKGLRRLALSDLRARSLAPIAGLRGLRSLTIHHCAVSGGLVAAPERLSFAALRGLEELDIGGRLAPAVFEHEGLGRCARLRILRWCDSDEAPLTSAAPLARLRHLRRLDLAGTRLAALDGLWELPLEALAVPATVPEAEVAAYQSAHPGCDVHRSPFRRS